MTLLDILYGLIFQPQATMRELARTKPLLAASLVFVAVYLANMLLQQASRSITETGLGLLPASLAGLLGAVGAAVSVAIWFIVAGLFSLLAEIIYGYGNGKGVLTCLGFAAFPGIFGPALYYASILVNLEPLGMVFYVISILWVIGLQVLALREALTLTTTQAILVYLLPVVMLLGILVLLLVMGGLALSSLPLP